MILELVEVVLEQEGLRVEDAGDRLAKKLRKGRKSNRALVVVNDIVGPMLTPKKTVGFEMFKASNGTPPIDNPPKSREHHTLRKERKATT